jgi:GDPmannose 4,6-dehydratase
MVYRDFDVQSSTYMRCAEVKLLVGHPLKTRQKLGWETQITFDELVHVMVNVKMRLIEEKYITNG